MPCIIVLGIYKDIKDLYKGDIKWGALQKQGNKAFNNNKESLEKDSFRSIEEDLHQYTGLIYDGAFSENQKNFKGDGLTGENIRKEKAKDVAIDFIGKEEIKEINLDEQENNGIIKGYLYNVLLKNNTETIINISKKGGHIISMNNNRDVIDINISDEQAIDKAKEYLNNKGFHNMKETYYMKSNNIITINFAYTQDEVIIYPDLIKVKIALDNSEILGIETTNYLNSHKDSRDISLPKITKEKALELINPKVEVQDIELTIIPTEYNTEVLCWEIKGKIYNKTENIETSNNFLVYINANTGKEEDILLIVDTPNGTLTM